MLVFDENRPTVECAGSNCGEEMALYCKDLLHGNGYTRWFDKSMTCVIYENGKVREREDETEKNRGVKKVVERGRRREGRGGGRSNYMLYVL